MAKKRMFNLDVLDTDAFLDMPLSAQALYFWLCMRADDDGFISNPKRIKDYIGASDDDLKLLVMKRFIITFEDGVIVIKHWRMHNTIQKDRYNHTNFQEDFKMLGILENKTYTLGEDGMETKCIQNVSTDIGLGLDIDSDSGLDLGLEKDLPPKKAVQPKKLKFGTYENVILTQEEYDRLAKDYEKGLVDKAIDYLSAYIIEKGYKSKSHNLSIRRWVIEAVSKQAPKSPVRSNTDYDWDNI